MKDLKILIVSVITAVVMCVAMPSTARSHAEGRTVRILAVGNSFSEDAIDQYFYDLCKADGRHVVVGDLYIGGCPLSRHLLNARTDSAAYRFRLIGRDGVMHTSYQVSLAKALAAEPWDYISFQQASGQSGMYGTYADLKPLMAYTDSLVPKHPTYLWHQTWAYAQNSKHPDFVNYQSNQRVMFDSIMSASRQIMAATPELRIIVPVGRAVQIARQALGDYNLTRDGYHLDKVLGRYIAACTWYEAVFGQTVVGNKYRPDALSPELALLAQECAHRAVIAQLNAAALPAEQK